MPLWLPRTAAEQPDVALTGWSAFKVNIPSLGTPTVHLVGYAEDEGRVTSPVTELDAKRRCAVTRSGRVYRLAGTPGLNSDAQYVWKRWLRMWQATVIEDVTQAMQTDFAEASDD